jgi:DNA-binding response OmpR family regulator
MESTPEQNEMKQETETAPHKGQTTEAISPKQAPKSKPAPLGKKILVVDDDELMRHAIKHTLSQEGFAVTAAIDGGDAIDRMKKELPDIILLDLMMPYVSGIEFLQLIRNQYAFGNTIPVIIISSLDQIELKEQGYNIEGFHFMSKPLDMIELVHWINHFLAFGEN